MPNLQAILAAVAALFAVIVPSATVFWSLAERDERVRRDLQSIFIEAVNRQREDFQRQLDSLEQDFEQGVIRGLNRDRDTRAALRAEDEKATKRRQALENEIKELKADISRVVAIQEDRRVLVDRLIEKEFKE